MRAFKLFLASFATVACTGCASYQLGPVNGAVAGEKSIEVQPFNNQTLQPRLGDALTQSLREQLQADATFHLATRGPGDIVVTGVIKQYTRQVLGYLSSDLATPENYRVEVMAHVTARDRLSGKLILDRDVKGHTLVNIGTDLASAERQASTLLAEDLAQNITATLAEGAW